MEHDAHHHHQQHQQQQAMEMELPPGFRFHPTDEELITHYLARKAADPRFAAQAVGEADLNRCEPWDLPARAGATWGKKEWYFFCIKDRKYPTGQRTNRATESGYWKATGKDREIFRGKVLVGMKKTLVFYTGRAPKGGKTGWVMREYRLEGENSAKGAGSSNLFHSIKSATSKDEWVLCRVFKKNIEPPSVAGGKRPGSSTFMETADVGPSMSMADELAAACMLPPLMDVSGSGRGVPTSLSVAAASIDQLPPPAHVTCFSNALEAQFLNPPFILPSAPAPASAAAHGAVAADHLAMASASAPFLARVQMQYDGGMVHKLLQGDGGWYGKLGERERLSGASQDTGVSSEVNPAEISSSRQHMMNSDASLWDF